MPRSFIVAAAALVAALVVAGLARDGRAGTRVATFNIEYYPKSDAQAHRALDVIASLDAPIVALQEITSPTHLVRHAQQRLGESWRFAAVDHRFATGVLFDSARVTLKSTRTWRETVVFPHAIPVFEARFDDGGDEELRVFVVHWKAGGENFPLRKKQLDALEPILDAAAEESERIVVLGDFNATGPDDRARIARLVDDVDMEWASQPLTCTCFWQRERDCVGSALDHVLTSEEPRAIRVAGACAAGCPAADRCPAWRQEVSDHCPVVVDVR